MRRTTQLLAVLSAVALVVGVLLALPTSRRPAPPAEVTATAVVQPVEVRTPAPHRPSRSRRVLPTGPSRLAMPHGDLRGWHQFLAEDFRGRALPDGWGAYTGQPGGNRHGWWDASKVAVGNGRLRLTGGWHDGRYVTGGVMSWAARSTYGRYDVRFRVQRAHGVTYTLLLWPAAGGWPAAGEIDFAEDGGGERRRSTATLHFGADNDQVQRSVSADFTQWHTLGVQWLPGVLVYTLDDRPWATVRTAAVPTGPMDLAVQLEAGRGTWYSPAPDGRTPALTALEVDWVVGYRRR